MRNVFDGDDSEVTNMFPGLPSGPSWDEKEDGEELYTMDDDKDEGGEMIVFEEQADASTSVRAQPELHTDADADADDCPPRPACGVVALEGPPRRDPASGVVISLYETTSRIMYQPKALMKRL